MSHFDEYLESYFPAHANAIRRAGFIDYGSCYRIGKRELLQRLIAAEVPDDLIMELNVHVEQQANDQQIRDYLKEFDPNEADNRILRRNSGAVTANRVLVSLLYELMRDHVLPGDVETLVRDVCRESGPVEYTNGFLALYAVNLADRLEKAQKELSSERPSSSTDHPS